MKITLYHGSLKKIESFKDDVQAGGLYLTSSIQIANNYIVSQGDDETGEYGYIYKVEVESSEIIETDDIDQAEKTNSVLFSKEEEYYRIDKCSKYSIVEMSCEEISQLI